MAVAPVDNGVGRSGERVKKLFGRVPTLIEVRATAMHNDDARWQLDVDHAVNGENGNQRP